MAAKQPTTVQARNAYLTLNKLSEVEVGSLVRVLRAFKDGELGCEIPWDEDMQEYVGQEYIVTGSYTEGEYELDHNYVWPFFALEVVGKSLSMEVGDYTATVADDGKTVEVGCQTITAENVFALADLMREQMAKAPKPVVKVAKVAKRRRR